MINHVVLLGRLVQDVKITKNKESSVAKFTLAVNKNKDEASFIECTAFNKVAESIEKYIKKGDRLAISGRLNQRKYTNKEGKNISLIEVLVDEISFIEHLNKNDDLNKHNLKLTDISVEINENNK